MLDGKKITLIATVDTVSKSYKKMQSRIFVCDANIQKMIHEENPERCCIVGRKTAEMAGWKGKNLWVLSKNPEYSRNNTGIIHSIEDIHLHIEADHIFVLGGISVFNQFHPYADEIIMFTITDKKGNEKWIDIDYSEWEAITHKSKGNWINAKLVRKPT